MRDVKFSIEVPVGIGEAFTILFDDITFKQQFHHARADESVTVMDWMNVDATRSSAWSCSAALTRNSLHSGGARVCYYTMVERDDPNGSAARTKCIESETFEFSDSR
jgi:hypothetical protein